MAAPLHIVLYHPSRLPVRKYGGTERVVVWLARGLAELGHRVTLMALAGTEVPEATLIEVPEHEAFRPGGARLEHFIPSGADLLHSHTTLAEPPTSVPYWWTFHGNGAPGRTFDARAIGLSADHARRHRLRQWVYNGLDPAEYTIRTHRPVHDLFIGRLQSVKGWRWAVQGARMSGHRIVMAGGWRPSLRRDVRYVGRVDDRAKARLLQHAACLWVPAQWDEPFGLTTIEAMASGVPVLGTPRGALPEIITSDSGLLGNTLEELVALRPQLDNLDPDAVRANVLARFTHRRMAESYLAIYRSQE